MRKVILYIATTLNGFIARKDGKLDWLTSIPNPQSGDYGYNDLLNRIDTIIMGRKTYDEVINYDMEWPYSGMQTYIVSNNKQFKIKSPDTQIIQIYIHDALAEMLSKPGKDIWLVGGGQLITSFLKHALIDEMIISVIPKIISDGLPLFASYPEESNWKLTEAKSFDTGVVNLLYHKTI